jgi:membrane protein YqaA with SNARE-associated domain
MPDILTQHGLLSLFLLSFCASTLLPIGSEWLLVVLLLKGGEPLTAVAVASLGNSLGALTSYLIGLFSGRWLSENLLGISQKQQQRAGVWFARYGSWALLFSWLPLVGDPLCLVAGMLRHEFLKFILLVTAGKTARYALVATLTLTGHALA